MDLLMLTNEPYCKVLPIALTFYYLKIYPYTPL